MEMRNDLSKTKNIALMNQKGKQQCRLRYVAFGIVLSLSLMWSRECNAEVCAFITNSSNNTISVIRTSDDTVVSTFNTGSGPIGITPDGDYLYVTNSGDRTVSAIRTSKKITIVPFLENPL